MKASEKIEILLHEYDTLRNEVINESNKFFQILVICSVLLGYFYSREIKIPNYVYFLVIALVVFACSYILTQVHKVTKRLRFLEKKVNGLAGENLLEYESSLGGAATSILFPSGPRKKN